MQATAAQAKAKQKNSKPKRKVLTSLLLEMLIAVGYLWGAVYYVLNILVFIYKGVHAWHAHEGMAREGGSSGVHHLLASPCRMGRDRACMACMSSSPCAPCAAAACPAGVTFPIPQQNFVMEFCFAWLWIFIDIPRALLRESRAQLACVA